MSFVNAIDFRRRAPGSARRDQSTSPQRSHMGGGGADEPEHRRSQTGSPDRDVGMSRRNPSQRLEEYAVASARHNRLSTTEEEGLVEFARLTQEEKLIDIRSKVTRIEQQMGISETRVGGSQPSADLPQIPKSMMDDINYKAALVMMSTAEEMDYHDGSNKPATVIMDSFRGRQDFDKSWLSGGKEDILQKAIGKVCNNTRYELKCEIADSISNKHDILTLTVNAVSRVSHRCGDITAHEALAVRMALLRAVHFEDPGTGFWGSVDKKLKEIKKECAQPDAIGFTEALNQIYNQDLVTYPPEDATLLSQARPTNAQSEINQHVRSRS